jgi:hypothetical protein
MYKNKKPTWNFWQENVKLVLSKRYMLLCLQVINIAVTGICAEAEQGKI